MQNRLFTYGFLLLMISALVTLAVLQYQWLGSVSNAEKQRLEEGIEASGENFVSDFNQVFTGLNNNFRIQVTNENTDVTPNIAESYLRWYDTFIHSEILSEVFFIQLHEDDDQVDYYIFDSMIGDLVTLNPDSATASWVAENLINKSDGKPTVSLTTLPNFGNDTFIDIPIQVLDFINLQRYDDTENLEVQLNINRLNDIVLLRINNEYVKSTLIPEIASRYFGESYNDQYQISVLKSGDNPFTYYNSIPEIKPDNPDLKVKMDRFNFSSIVMLNDQFGETNIKFESSDSSRFNYVESSTQTSRAAIRHVAQFESNSEVENDIEQHRDTVFGFRTSPATIDTTIATAFVGNISSDTWELWLSFKEGSLDEFVQKTRNTNLGISFGVLGILGISCVLIVIFANRSRNLAEQQMLFVAGVSHELRTPLSVIRSAAENLNEGVVQSEERKKEYAQLMLKEGRRLSDMVDQIMEFSGIQTGKRIYTFRDVDVEQLLTEVKEEFKPIFEEHNLTLEYANIAKLNTIQADRDALFLAITNLLHNALKFSNGSEKVVIRLDEISFKSGLALRVQVQDFGVGIPVEEQNHVFKPFYRARRSVENQIKGNGIGLSLVQKVAKAHQGNIQLKSIEGEGSTFTLVIPYHV